MFVLNINTNTENVDVNVTPDKLQMFIRNEAILMAIIKSSLLKLYSRLYKTVSLDESSINASGAKSQAIMSSFLRPATSQINKPKLNLNLDEGSKVEIESSEKNDENQQFQQNVNEEASNIKRTILEPTAEKILTLISSNKVKQAKVSYSISFIIKFGNS